MKEFLPALPATYSESEFDEIQTLYLFLMVTQHCRDNVYWEKKVHGLGARDTYSLKGLTEKQRGQIVQWFVVEATRGKIFNKPVVDLGTFLGQVPVPTKAIVMERSRSNGPSSGFDEPVVTPRIASKKVQRIDGTALDDPPTRGCRPSGWPRSCGARVELRDDVWTIGMPRHRLPIAATALWIAVSCGWPAPLSAQGTGPEFWAVTGVGAGKLNVRAQPSTSSDPVGTLPHDARGVANLGCRGGSGPAADDAEGQGAARNRWCRVRYKGVEGWVAARFLKADPGPQAVEPKAPVDPGPRQAAAPKAPVDPGPPAIVPKAPADPGPQAAAPKAPDGPAPPATVPKAPVEPGARVPLSFTCTGTEAIAVMVDAAGAVTHERYPPREAIRLTLSVTPSAPESAGPVATATIWQMLGQQGERIEGSIAWGKAIDARDGQWRLDLRSRTLHIVRARQGTSAHFFRFSCE